MRNTRGELCKPSLQNCCPHMEPNDKGLYRATNETSDFQYNGTTYLLKTCCQMCADAMKNNLKLNKELFETAYKPKLVGSKLLLSNQATGKPIQLLPTKL